MSASKMESVLSWAEIRQQFPRQWVGLLDIVEAPDGWIASARVFCHDVTMDKVSDVIGTSNPDVTVVHTGGLRLWTPRFEVLDEEDNVVPPRR